MLLPAMAVVRLSGGNPLNSNQTACVRISNVGVVTKEKSTHKADKDGHHDERIRAA
jgi:hypothetical protein